MRDNNDTELTIIITTATLRLLKQVPSEMTTKLTAAETTTEVDQA